MSKNDSQITFDEEEFSLCYGEGIKVEAVSIPLRILTKKIIEHKAHLKKHIKECEEELNNLI